MNKQDFERAELILDLHKYMCKTPKNKNETRMLKLYAEQVTKFARYCSSQVETQNSYLEDIEKLAEELNNANNKVNQIKQLLIKEKQRSEYKYYGKGLIEIREFTEKYIADAMKSYESEE